MAPRRDSSTTKSHYIGYRKCPDGRQGELEGPSSARRRYRSRPEGTCRPPAAPHELGGRHGSLRSLPIGPNRDDPRTVPREHADPPDPLQPDRPRRWDVHPDRYAGCPRLGGSVAPSEIENAVP